MLIIHRGLRTERCILHNLILLAKRTAEMSNARGEPHFSRADRHRAIGGNDKNVVTNF